MAFLYSAVKVFLTFPRCDIEKEDALEVLQWFAWDHNNEVDYAVVAHEFHSDGGNHLHIFAKFTKKVQTRDPRYFDVIGGFQHANIEVCFVILIVIKM